MHLPSRPPGISALTSAASQIIVLGYAELEAPDRKVADVCHRIRLLDDQYQSATRMVAEADSRGDRNASDRFERECARSAVRFLEALVEMGSTTATSLVGIGLKAATLAHFLPRFRDEVAVEHLLLVAAFADEVSAYYPRALARGEQEEPSLCFGSDEQRVLTFSIADYISKREALLLSLAAAAQSYAPEPVHAVPGEAEYLDKERWLAAQLMTLAHQDLHSITELLALAGIVAGLARQDPGAAISNFVIVLGLKLCDTVLVHLIV